MTRDIGRRGGHYVLIVTALSHPQVGDASAPLRTPRYHSRTDTLSGLISIAP